MPAKRVRTAVLIRERSEKQAYYDIKQSLTFNVERDVLYDDSGGYDLVVPSRRAGSDWRLWCMHVTHGRRAPGGGQIGVVWGRQRAIVRYTCRVVEPLLVIVIEA